MGGLGEPKFELDLVLVDRVHEAVLVPQQLPETRSQVEHVDLFPRVGQDGSLIATG
jgi:hypothetical protein